MSDPALLRCPQWIWEILYILHEVCHGDSTHADTLSTPNAQMLGMYGKESSRTKEAPRSAGGCTPYNAYPFQKANGHWQSACVTC
jgi:hypothetical protein